MRTYDGCSERRVASASPRDGLVLGLAQALALIPGVSRSGATFAAARARGFSRKDADRLSWKVGLPVIWGATLLEGTRLWRAKPPRELTLPLAAGAAFLGRRFGKRSTGDSGWTFVTAVGLAAAYVSVNLWSLDHASIENLRILVPRK